MTGPVRSVVRTADCRSADAGSTPARGAWQEADYYAARDAARSAWAATDQQLSFGLSERGEEPFTGRSSGLDREAGWGNHHRDRTRPRSLSPSTLTADGKIAGRTRSRDGWWSATRIAATPGGPSAVSVDSGLDTGTGEARRVPHPAAASSRVEPAASLAALPGGGLNNQYDRPPPRTLITQARSRGRQEVTVMKIALVAITFVALAMWLGALAAGLSVQALSQVIR